MKKYGAFRIRGVRVSYLFISRYSIGPPSKASCPRKVADLSGIYLHVVNKFIGSAGEFHMAADQITGTPISQTCSQSRIAT